MHAETDKIIQYILLPKVELEKNDSRLLDACCIGIHIVNRSFDIITWKNMDDCKFILIEIDEIIPYTSNDILKSGKTLIDIISYKDFLILRKFPCIYGTDTPEMKKLFLKYKLMF